MIGYISKHHPVMSFRGPEARGNLPVQPTVLLVHFDGWYQEIATSGIRPPRNDMVFRTAPVNDHLPQEFLSALLHRMAG